MVLGFHVIVSTYGFWLPNDPRGSWSDWIRNWELLRFGGATKVDTRRSIAGVPHDASMRTMAKRTLAYPEVYFSGEQAQAVGFGFRDVVAETDYQIFACSIMSQHVHLVIGPNSRSIARIVGHLKGRATQKLNDLNLHPLARYRQADRTVPSPWGPNSWKVFIFTEQHLRDAIQYVEDNPLKEGKRRQNWSFVASPAPRRPR